jgi:APA family basic amino acid/polyamine antiporter
MVGAASRSCSLVTGQVDLTVAEIEAATSLRRSVTLPWLVLYGLGTTIGAGIYALTGVVAGLAGMQAPISFLLATGLASFTALSFAELGSRFPQAAGEAVYVREGFGLSWLATGVGLLAVLAGVVSAATVIVAFVGYLPELAALPRPAAIVLAVLLLGGLAAWGVQQSVVVAGLLTIIEVGGLLLVVAFGFEHLAATPERIIEIIPSNPTEWRGASVATVLCFYAFLGFEDIVNVAEEVRDVRRTLPRAILLTLVGTSVLYALVSTVSVVAVPPAELAAAAAPLSLVFERCGGAPGVMGVIAIVALLNGALIQLIKASRILYGLARDGSLPTLLGRVSKRTQTPLNATLLSVAVVITLALAFPLAQLAEATASIALVTFSLVNLSLVLVKRTSVAPEGVTEVPSWVPVVGFLASLFFLLVEASRVLGQ